MTECNIRRLLPAKCSLLVVAAAFGREFAGLTRRMACVRTQILKRMMLCLLAAVLSGCGSSSRYQLAEDMGPSGEVDISHIAEPKPVATTPGRRGNKSPYKVFGKKYSVMTSSQGYVEEGVASWYGKKFHGYHTSNGEIYDMYRYSAAHKSLPLPIYARVTNLSNGRQVIVRINDRGPFHGNRLIDLSYAAAKKLDYLASGTARVRVEAFPFAETAAAEALPSQQNSKALVNTAPEYFLQVGAYSDKQVAVDAVEYLSSQAFTPAFYQQVGSEELYRVQVGPFIHYQDAASIRSLLKTSQYPDSFIVSRP